MLGGAGTSQYEPTEFDYFHDFESNASPTFRIMLRLEGDEQTLPAVQGAGNPQRVHGVLLRGSTESGGRLTHRRTLVDADDKEILISPRTSLKGKAKEEFKGTPGTGWQGRYARVDEIRHSLPDVWLLTPHNLEASLYRWQTGPLRRLSELLARKFLRDDWTFKFKDQDCPMPQKLVAAHAFFREAVQEFPFWKDQLKPRLQQILTEYVGSHTAFDLQPNILTIEEWLVQQLSVAFAADAGGAKTPLECMGDGFQSLIRLAALEALGEFPDEVSDRVVLLLEEPETHLHPHLQRKMCSVLNRLSQLGWLVVTATHCPNLISFDQAQTVVRLSRKGVEVTKGKFETSTASEGVKLQHRLQERGSHEMLFGSAAVLCEGKDDTWAIRSTIKKLAPNLDLNARSITFVDAGGSGGLADHASISKQLGIRWCAVTDEDKEPGKPPNATTEAVRSKLASLRGTSDESIYWPVDLETCLGCKRGKATPEWQAKNTDLKGLSELEGDHGDLIKVCEKIVAWLG